tara:strand:- start:29 stop:1267 length:1239 start_codon:yes stop_codon:yes gene_type:complete
MPTQTKEDAITHSALCPEILEGLSKDTAAARGLPNEAFTTQEFLDLEQRHAFARSWVFAGRVSAIPNRGDVEPVEVAGRSLFVARGSDDRVRVFHNVCPHRGARLVVEFARGAPALTCPYHAWSFTLDGELKGRPHYHGPEQHDRDGRDSGVCLFQVRSAIWHDWVFVNLDGKACDFEDYMAPVNGYYKGWDLSAFCYAYHDSFEFRCNWKLAVENFCDTYHVFKVHPKLDEAYTSQQRDMARPEGVHMFMFNTLTGDSPGLTVGVDGPVPPEIPGLAAECEREQRSCNVFPNVTVVVQPSNLQFVEFEPVGPDRCIMHLLHYFVGDAAHDPAENAARERVYADWLHINREDEGICHRLQEGRSCDAYDGGRLAPYWDVGTAYFHRHIADAILGQGEFAPSEEDVSKEQAAS